VLVLSTFVELLGRGSPATIATCLKRFWRDLGIRAHGDPAALTRLPSEIIEAVEAIWQRSLALAAQTAHGEDNAARQRLEQLKIENEVRAQSFEMRERAYETAVRERALADSRDHLLSTLRMLESDRAPLKARETRIAEHSILAGPFSKSSVDRVLARSREMPMTLYHVKEFPW